MSRGAAVPGTFIRISSRCSAHNWAARRRPPVALRWTSPNCCIVPELRARKAGPSDELSAKFCLSTA